MPSDQISDLILPHRATWGSKGQSESTWYITPTFSFTSFSTFEVNTWLIEKISRTFDAFSHLARVWDITMQSSPLEEEVDILRQRYKKGNFYRTYISEILKQISCFRKPVYLITMELDLFVFVYTGEIQINPVQGWVRNLADFRFVVDLHTRSSSFSFSLTQSLFQAFVPEYGNGDNQELHALNQPLLCKALQEWEESIGEIIEFEGPLGRYKYGFSSNPVDYGR